MADDEVIILTSDEDDEDIGDYQEEREESDDGYIEEAFRDELDMMLDPSYQALDDPVISYQDEGSEEGFTLEYKDDGWNEQMVLPPHTELLHSADIKLHPANAEFNADRRPCNAELHPPDAELHPSSAELRPSDAELHPSATELIQVPEVHSDGGNGADGDHSGGSHGDSNLSDGYEEVHLKLAVANDRIHKLEQERRDLLKQLTSYKEDVLYSDHTHTTVTTKLGTINNSQSKVISELTDENRELRALNGSLLAENKQLHLKVSGLEHLKECESSSISKVEQSYRRTVATLKERVKHLEDFEKKYNKVERRMRELERERRDTEDSRRIVAISMKQLEDYEDLKNRNDHLTNENAVLRERVDNVELLTYQLQKMREKCLSFESRQKDVDRLVVENQELTDKLDKLLGDASTGGHPPTSSLLTQHYRILQLQQNEVILTHKCGELESQVKLTQQWLDTAKREIEDLKLKLSSEKDECTRQQDMVRRLERRVHFIAKEREGCVKVLNSYKVDGNVDTVVREMNKELQESLSRASLKITELERTIEQVHYSADEERKRVNTAELDRASLLARIKMLEETNMTLQLERQSFEDSLAKSSTT